MGWILPEIMGRIFTEDFALDSYQNLLFSVCRFHEITGNYPTRITVVGYEFKKSRFLDFHLKAIKYPKISHGYTSSCPEISDLINFCPADRVSVFNQTLPWSV
ncbi:hypothetical protein AYI68_g4126 [Smittium mucronatum]|uniref:Uncharacterized protein n=1 Tax=Smittium mucronatum TaxID=133383 RepID=A0A1R0GXY0_9FUNG|nr:hypothetical protein AYI68_g4126 [Smittium mucronatum]